MLEKKNVKTVSAKLQFVREIIKVDKIIGCTHINTFKRYVHIK